MIYRKRTESNLVTACLKYLQVQENIGKIVWVMRINAGMIKSGKRLIRLGRKGTSDILVVLKTGVCLWVECKNDMGKQNDSQVEFEGRLNGIPNHHYFIVRNLDDLHKYLQVL